NLLARGLNEIVGGPLIYEKNRFAGINLRPETAKLLSLSAEIPKNRNIAWLNRLLLEDCYPQLSRKHKLDPAKAALYALIYELGGLPGMVLAGLALRRWFRGSWPILCLVL